MKITFIGTGIMGCTTRCNTSFCDNYYKMCNISDYMFSDVTGLKTTDMHMGLED